MAKRNYTNTAPPVALTSSINNVVTAVPVASIAGYPSPPFIIAIERGTANEEVCLVTASTTGSFSTVVRGYDGTTAKSHALGAMVEHTVSAIDYREAGVVYLTTAERDALTGSDLWDGRLISNTTTDTLDRYDLGTTTWVSFARMSDVTTAITSGITGKADKTTTITAGSGLTGGGDLSANRSLAVNFHSNGAATTVTRSDDTRLSDARTPLTHSHAQSEITGLVSALSGKADAASPTLSGTITLGTSDADVIKSRGIDLDVDQRNVTVNYSGTDVSTVVEKNGVTTVKTTTLTWSSGVLTTVTEVVGAVTATTTLNYDGSGNYTGYTRTVT